MRYGWSKAKCMRQSIHVVRLMIECLLKVAYDVTWSCASPLVYRLVIVTHNMQQAARASDWVGFFLPGGTFGIRPQQGDFHQPQRPADGELHYRKVRMTK
jgi:hypothetical protein